MEQYRQKRTKTERTGTVAGVAVAVGVHVLLALYGTFTGLSYIYPPPEEQTFLIDFTEVVEEPVKQVYNGSQPHAEEVDRTRPVELVQSSQAQEKGRTANKAREATMGEDGDVEKYEPQREKPIDNRALFHAADNKTDKDTLAPQTASDISESLKAGHAMGNTPSGKTTGEPNAHLKGRHVLGNIQRPEYNVQESGIVVVAISVDRYGNVVKAVPGVDGTTVTNQSLWAAAKKAAMETHFNQKSDAPEQQQGTITYIFNLK
ncbi:MAG: hypothetical protein VZQ27_03325 [Candidatus Cryptobacteroides sp.]|nr:hypothetical protein [Candidatus Cryptobacteroides sp.]